MSQSFHCPSCGGPLDFDNRESPTMRCPYCRSSVIIPESLRASAPSARVFSAEQAFDELPELVTAMAEIARLVGDGKKLDAIKLFRDHFESSLKEAVDVIEQIEQGQVVTLSDLRVASIGAPSAPISREALKAELNELLGNQQKIQAIKRFRDVYPLGLKEAKEAIEQMEHDGHLPEIPNAQADSLGETLDQALQLAQVAHLAQTGQRSEATHLYRQVFDTSLQEAEKVVEQLADGQNNDPDWVVSRVQHNLRSTALPRITPKQAAAVGGGAGCAIIGFVAFILLTVVVPVLFGLSSSGGPLESLKLQINPLAPARLVASMGSEGIGAGRFDDPRAIAAASDGTYYVAEYSDGRVQHLGADGSSLNLWNIGKAQYVSDLFFTEDGVLNMVYRGKLWRYAAESGKELGALEIIDSFYVDSAAAAPDGGMVVFGSDETLLRLNADLQIIWVIPEVVSSVTDASIGSGELTVDGLGNIYILSASESSVFKFSPEGRYLTRWGSAGDQPGQLRAVNAIAVDGNGRIYISDIYGIKIFESDGRYLDTIDVIGVAFGLAFNPQNQLVAVSNTPKVYVYKLK